MGTVRKSVFVHVGAPAARTTFLQRQLAANEVALDGAGIGFVGPDHRDDRSPERLAARVLAIDHPTIVVSDDRLAATDDVSRLLDALAGHHVQVIYGVPDLGTAIVAEWQRHVLSTHRPESLDAWVDGLVAGEHPTFWRTYGLSDVFTRWTLPSGDVHVIVAPTGPDSAGELWTRFAAIVGAPAHAAEGVAPGEDVVGLEVLELLCRVDATLPEVTGRDAHDIVRDVVASRAAAGSRSTHPVVPARHKAWVDRQSSLQRKFLEGSGFEVVGDPADLEVDDDQFGDGEVVPDDEAVLAAGIETGAVLVERLIAAREQRRVVVRRIVRQAPPAPATTLGIAQRARGKASRVGASTKVRLRRAGLRVAHRDRRTYYLHIGAPKCGSTYLQSLLWRNRDALMQNGVYVPGRAQSDHFYAGTDFRGSPYETQSPDDSWRGGWDRLVDDAERTAYRKIVISSEFLATAAPEAIARRLERLADADVQVVYAVRDFAGLLASVWQQHVKTAPVRPWTEWLDALAERGGAEWLWTQHNVGQIVERWTGNGIDQLHLLVLPPAGSPQDELWRRFRSIVGWQVRTSSADPRGNESLGYAQAEVLRRLQQLLAEVEPRSHRARITKNLIGDLTLAPMERVDRLLIPDRLRPWVDDQSAERRAQIASSSAHVVGDLDDLRVADSRFSRDPAGPNPAAMLDAAVAVVSAVAVTMAREAAAAAAPSGEAP